MFRVVENIINIPEGPNNKPAEENPYYKNIIATYERLTNEQGNTPVFPAPLKKDTVEFKKKKSSEDPINA